MCGIVGTGFYLEIYYLIPIYNDGHGGLVHVEFYSFTEMLYKRIK